MEGLVERFFLAPGSGDTNLAASEREVSIPRTGVRSSYSRPTAARWSPRSPLRTSPGGGGRARALRPRRGPRRAVVAEEPHRRDGVRRGVGGAGPRAAIDLYGGPAVDRERAQRRGAAPRAGPRRAPGVGRGPRRTSPDEHALLRRAAEVEAEQAARKNAVVLARTRGWMVVALSGVGLILALDGRCAGAGTRRGASAGAARERAPARGRGGEPRRHTAPRGAGARAGPGGLGPLFRLSHPPEVTRSVAEALSAMSGHRLRGHGAPVVGVGCAPDGTITSVDCDGVVLTWRGGVPTRGGAAPDQGISARRGGGPGRARPGAAPTPRGPGVTLRWRATWRCCAPRTGPPARFRGTRRAACAGRRSPSSAPHPRPRRHVAPVGHSHRGAAGCVPPARGRAARPRRLWAAGRDRRGGRHGRGVGARGRRRARRGEGRRGVHRGGVVGERRAHDGPRAAGAPRRSDDRDPRAGRTSTAWHPWEVDPTGSYSLNGDIPAILLGPDGARPLGPVGEPVLYASWSTDGRKLAGSHAERAGLRVGGRRPADPLRRADIAAVYAGVRAAGARDWRRRRGLVVPRHRRARRGPPDADLGRGVGGGRAAGDRVARSHGGAVGRDDAGGAAGGPRKPRAHGGLVGRRHAPRDERGRPNGAAVDRRRGRAGAFSAGTTTWCGASRSRQTGSSWCRRATTAW